MSLRSITRSPAKRMLVFFEEDKTTSILNTSKVKQIIGSGNKLEHGAVVVVEYENVDYEALVIKLHDDPTVLSMAETDFLKCQQFKMDGSDVKELDKENIQPSKRPKTSPMQGKVKNKVRKLKEPQGKQPKTKKIISIDAETLPSNNNKSAELHSTPKDETKPGTLTFLDAQEQIRVQRLLTNYIRGEVKEVGMQTDQETEEAEGIKEKTFMLPQKDVGEKWVQTEVTPPCKCQEFGSKIDLLQTKVDYLASIILDSQIINCSTTEGSFNINEFVVSNDSQTPPRIHNNLIQVSPDAPLEESELFVTESSDVQREPHIPTECGEQSSSTTISSELFDDIFRASASMSNYAKNLVFKLFTIHELIGSNCAGAKGKRSLEQDQRMGIIKDAIFKKYHVEDKTKSWGVCRRAIDSAIRHIKPKV